MISKRNLLFPGSIFKGYISFREGMYPCRFIVTSGDDVTPTGTSHTTYVIGELWLMLHLLRVPSCRKNTMANFQSCTVW